MSDSPGQRLQSFRKTLGLTQRSFASALEVSNGWVASLETGAGEISRAFLAKLSDTYNLNADWLLNGHGDMLHAPTPGFKGRAGRIEPPEHGKPAHGDLRFDGHDYVFVKRMDLSISAGNGLVPLEGEESARMAFPAAQLSKMGINADLAVLVRVMGDSMIPQIPDGALALVHAMEMTVDRDAIYAFIRDGQAFVKRIVPSGTLRDGRPSSLMIVAANPAYPPVSLSGAEMNSIRIVGRVRYVIFAT